MGRLQSTPTTNEYVLKWFFLAVFSFCSGMRNLSKFLNCCYQFKIKIEGINMGNFLEYMSKFSTVRYSFGMIGDFDKKITPDSLLVTAATFMIFAFCGLVSHTDFQFLMTCIASIGTGIVFWPTGGWLLNLTSLLVFFHIYHSQCICFFS